MSRNVQHVEVTVPEVDDVALLQHLGGRCGLHAITRFVESAGREALEHLEFCVAVSEGAVGRGGGENVCLEDMARALAELMMISDVIEVRVAGNGEQRFAAEPGELFHETDDTGTRVEQEVSISATHVPDVASIKDADVGLVNMGHAARVRCTCVPLLGVERRVRAGHGARAALWPILAAMGATSESVDGTARDPSGPNTARG